jgi:hypothetical protein
LGAASVFVPSLAFEWFDFLHALVSRGAVRGMGKASHPGMV